MLDSRLEHGLMWVVLFRGLGRAAGGDRQSLGAPLAHRTQGVACAACSVCACARNGSAAHHGPASTPRGESTIDQDR